MSAATLRWLVAIALILGTRAEAGPLQLRADALATTASPAGLLTLEADGAIDRGLSAEAVVWMGSASDDGRADGVGHRLHRHQQGMSGGHGRDARTPVPVGPAAVPRWLR